MKAAHLMNRWSGGEIANEFRGASTLTDTDPRANEYRRISDLKRDLKPLEFDRQRELAYYIWQRNPIGQRMIGSVVEFCAGDDFSVDIAVTKKQENGERTVVEGRREANEIWYEFCEREGFYDVYPELFQDCLISGELVMPVFSRTEVTSVGTIAGDGQVSLGFADPSTVQSVKVDPVNLLHPLALEFRDVNGVPFSRSVVRRTKDPLDPYYGLLQGDVLYFRMNRLTNQSRGHSWLIDVLDWLDMLDQFLFDALKGFQARNTWFWSVMMKGKTLEELLKIQENFQVPASAAARLHNENVEYNAKAPDLNAIDIDKALMTVQTFVVGSKGYPMTWFGTGEDANRASSENMAVPTMQMLRKVQKFSKRITTQIAKFVCDQAVIARRLKLGEGEDIRVTVNAYDFERKDAAGLGSAFQQFIAALVIARDSGWVSDKTAKQLVDSMLTRVGVRPDENETVDSLKADLDQRRQERAKEEADQTYADVGFDNEE